MINNIEQNLEDKDVKEKIKSNKKFIKEILKKQIDKIKKVDEVVYNDMKEAYDRLDKETTKVGIEQIRDVLFESLNKEHINKRLTLNLFKSILSNTYFGQPSFLNVVKTALSYEEQQEVMYVDYVSNIVETGFIHDIVDEKYSDIEELQREINFRLESGRITNEVSKLYEKVKKSYIKKGKSLEDIRNYLKGALHQCSMCENDSWTVSNYSEENFVPLAISSDNARNFFWNQNAKFPICDICKLILFCVPAGMTNIRKIVRENGEYKEKSLLNFVNFDTSVEMLIKTNNNFKNRSRFENRNDSSYAGMILDIVGQDEKISEWQLGNIFVVEIEAEYGAFSRIEYFNIKRYVAEFFTKYSKRTLLRIVDYKYKLQLVDSILKNKDLKNIITERLRYEITNSFSGYNSFLATQVRAILNLLKKEGKAMEIKDKIDKSNSKLYVLYNLGVEIHEKLKRDNQENKIDGYTYKMLNSIKTGNVNEFMDIVIRIHMSIGKDVSPIFVETMQDSDLDFESIGHSFLAGLISNKYEKKSEEND